MLKIGDFSIQHLTQRTNYVTSNAIDQGNPALVAALGRDLVAAFGRQFRGLIPEVGLGHPAFLVRFGYAPRRVAAPTACPCRRSRSARRRQI